MQLNEKQNLALRKVTEGKNLFIDGPGGTGKSVLIKKIMELFSGVVLCAPTGIAALNIGGATIHSTFGFPFHILTKRDFSHTREKTEQLFSKEGPVRMIVLDEISMVRTDILHAMDQQLRRIRRLKHVPFGGLQVVVVGDFYQLPPVVTRNEEHAFSQHYSSPFSFSDETWSGAEFEHVQLTQIMRQSDENFISHLMNIRSKSNDWKGSIDYLNSVCVSNREVVLDNDPVFLCSINRNADTINTNNYDEIDDEEHIFYGRKSGKISNQLPSPIELKLKYGTKVILTANTDNYKNGQTGYFMGVVGDRLEILLEENEQTVLVEKYRWEEKEYSVGPNGLTHNVSGAFTQYPIKHGWALTIHKCLSGDTNIETRKGKVKLKDINVGDEVYTKEGYNTVLNKWETGVKKTYLVKTKMGRSIKSSIDHKFFSCIDDGYPNFNPLKNLKVGDHIACSVKGLEYKSNNIDNDLSYIMGCIVGDGCYSISYKKDHRIDITSKDKEVLKSFDDIMKRYGNVGVVKSKINLETHYIHSKKLRQIFYDYGFDYVTAKYKTVPYKIINGSFEERINFISGWLDTDGYVSKNEKYIKGSTSSYNLATQIKEMLFSLGVISYINVSTNDSYQVIVSGYYYDILANILKLKIGYKRENLYRYKTNNKIKSNFDTIPFTKVITNNFSKKVQLTDRSVRSYGNSLGRNSNRKKGRIFYLQEAKNKNALNLIDNNVNYDFYYDEIISIQEIEPEVMYDIEVKDEHNFIANGMLVHNCQGQTLNNGIIHLGGGAFCHGQTYVALSRMKSMEGMAFMNPIKYTDIIVSPEINEFYANDCKGIGLF